MKTKRFQLVFKLSVAEILHPESVDLLANKVLLYHRVLIRGRGSGSCLFK